MFSAAGDEVDAGGVDGGMAEHVGKLSDVFRGAVKNSGEEMAQVVGKDFAFSHTGARAEGFHFCPDLFTRKGTTVSGAKEHA